VNARLTVPRGSSASAAADRFIISVHMIEMKEGEGSDSINKMKRQRSWGWLTNLRRPAGRLQSAGCRLQASVRAGAGSCAALAKNQGWGFVVSHWHQPTKKTI
jgi:hypothetical protein